MFSIETDDLPKGLAYVFAFKGDYVEAYVGSGNCYGERDIKVVCITLHDYGIQIKGGPKLHKATIDAISNSDEVALRNITLRNVMCEFADKPCLFLDFVLAIKNEAHTQGVCNTRRAMLAALGIERYE